MYLIQWIDMSGRVRFQQYEDPVGAIVAHGNLTRAGAKPRLYIESTKDTVSRNDPKTMSHLKTPNDGAAVTRRQIIQHIHTQQAEHGAIFVDGNALVQFIRGMPRRARKPGGLGRKKKK